MRITGLTLMGYIGIYNGLGLREITIDLSKARYKICLIAGPNGTGKSTIIKALNLLPDPNTCFIPNQNASKTLTVEHQDVVYQLSITSVCNNGKRTNEGHIFKNGIDLNPNGNITSYKEIVFTEFDIDANFIAMSLISSEDRGLADKTPAERKKVIASRIESLEVYNEMYKSLNKKANIFKSHLNSITSKLQNLGNKDDLIMRLSEIQKSEFSITAIIEDNKKALIEAETQIRMLDPTSTIGNRYTELSEKFDISSKDLRDIETKLNTLKIKVNGDDTVESATKEISANNNTIAGLHGERKQLVLMSSELDSQITELRNSIKDLESQEIKDSTLDTAKKAKEEKERELNALMEEFESNNKIFEIKSCNEIDSNTLDRIITVCNDIALVPQFDQDITIDEDILITKLIGKYVNDFGTIHAAISALIAEKNRLIGVIKESTDKLDTLSRNRYSLSGQMDEEKLQLTDTTVPNNCSKMKRGKCDLYDRYSDLCTKYKEHTREIGQILNEIEEVTTTINHLQSEQGIISNAIERLKSLSNIINYLSVCADDFDLILNEISIRRMCDSFVFKNALQISKDLATIIGLKEQLYDLCNYRTERTRYLTSISAIESSIEKHRAIIENIGSINRQIEAKDIEKRNINKKISSIMLQLETCETLGKKLETKLDFCKMIDEFDVKFAEKSRELEEIQTELMKMKDTGNQIQMLMESIRIHQSKVDVTMERLVEVSNEKKRIESQILIWDNFQKEYTEYNEKYNYVNILRKYSSPTQGGIQSLYMSMYMNKTLDLSNQILSMLFNGQYRILDYIINENEFRIPFIGSGMMVDDISSGSTSQKCIMGSIISMVSNASASPVYNIALLDEVDGGLDQDNRMMFADTILKAAEILNIDQLFSISHSIEASINNVDVILLSNDQNYIDQFANSNIIYMYEGGK